MSNNKRVMGMLVLVLVVLTALVGCNTVDPVGQWQLTETINAGECAATESQATVRKLNITEEGGGYKVVDADLPDDAGAYTAEIDCTLTDCTALLAYESILDLAEQGTWTFNRTYYLTLDGATNDITGEFTSKLHISTGEQCQFEHPIVGTRYALPE